MRTEEGWLTLPDSHKLYTKTWKTSGQPKARIVLIHGYSDHINHYTQLLDALSAKGIETYAFDQRGWGRSVQSPPQRGLTGPTEKVLEDITCFIKSVTANDGDDAAPLFMMGHSMGGQETLHYAANGPPEMLRKFRGFIAEAPCVGLPPTTRPWKITVVLGRLAGKLLPHMHMVNKLDPQLLSRDPEIVKDYETDPLCHNTGTLEGLAGLIDRAAALDKGDVVVKEGAGEGGKTRILVLHGTADGICDFGATKKMYDRLSSIQDREMRVFEGGYHILHAEPGEDGKRFREDVVKWVMDRSGPLEGGVAKSRL